MFECSHCIGCRDERTYDWLVPLWKLFKNYYILLVCTIAHAVPVKMMSHGATIPGTEHMMALAVLKLYQPEDVAASFFSRE